MCWNSRYQFFSEMECVFILLGIFVFLCSGGWYELSCMIMSVLVGYLYIPKVSVFCMVMSK
jgi:hypothetical protein